MVLAEIMAVTSAMRPRVDVAYCVHALSRRLAKTHNWTVWIAKFWFLLTLMWSMFFPSLIWQFCLQTYISNFNLLILHSLCCINQVLVGSSKSYAFLSHPILVNLFNKVALLILLYSFCFFCFRNLLMMQFLRFGLYGSDSLSIGVL